MAPQHPRLPGSSIDDSAASEIDRLMREHVPAFYRCAYRWTGAAERAEDLVQELLVRIFPRLAELRGLDQVRPWAMRVMYRIFVEQLRRAQALFGAGFLALFTVRYADVVALEAHHPVVALPRRTLDAETVLQAEVALLNEHYRWFVEK